MMPLISLAELEDSSPFPYGGMSIRRRVLAVITHGKNKHLQPDTYLCHNHFIN